MLPLLSLLTKDRAFWGLGGVLHVACCRYSCASVSTIKHIQVMLSFSCVFFFSAILGLSSAVKAGFNREDTWTSRVQKKCCKPFLNNSVILPVIVYCVEWVYQMCCFNQKLFAGFQTPVPLQMCKICWKFWEQWVFSSKLLAGQCKIGK